MDLVELNDDLFQPSLKWWGGDVCIDIYMYTHIFVCIHS